MGISSDFSESPKATEGRASGKPRAESGPWEVGVGGWGGPGWGAVRNRVRVKDGGTAAGVALTRRPGSDHLLGRVSSHSKKHTGDTEIYQQQKDLALKDMISLHLVQTSQRLERCRWKAECSSRGSGGWERAQAS